MSILEASFIQKYKDRSLSWLIKKATENFNAWIRKRDTDENGCIECISCGKLYLATGMHAGHYLPTTYASTRFYENNVHGQCVRCNMHLHGNQANYRINLIKKLGLEEVEKIETYAKVPYKWDRFSLIDIIQKYK